MRARKNAATPLLLPWQPVRSTRASWANIRVATRIGAAASRSTNSAGINRRNSLNRNDHASKSFSSSQKRPGYLAFSVSKCVINLLPYPANDLVPPHRRGKAGGRTRKNPYHTICRWVSLAISSARYNLSGTKLTKSSVHTFKSVGASERNQSFSTSHSSFENISTKNSILWSIGTFL